MSRKFLAVPLVFDGQYHGRDFYTGNTIESQGYLFVYIYVCVDIHMSFCSLTLLFLCLLRGLPLPISLLNRIFRFSDPVSFKEI